MAVVVKTLTGSNSERYDKVPYRHIYILNDGNTGWIKINEAIELDIEKIDKVEDLIIKRLEWAISGSGSTHIVLSHEKLSTDYIMRLMLSRIYTELQTKSSKKKIVFVDASSSTTVTAGSVELITVQPPSGKIWRIIDLYVDIPIPGGATTGTHYLTITKINGQYSGLLIYSPYDSKIHLSLGAKFAGTLSGNADVNTISNYLTRTKISHDYPQYFRYDNQTDADQASTKVIRLWVEEEDEAE